jgi:hypothetical protein
MVQGDPVSNQGQSSSPTPLPGDSAPAAIPISQSISLPAVSDSAPAAVLVSQPASNEHQATPVLQRQPSSQPSALKKLLLGVYRSSWWQWPEVFLDWFVKSTDPGAVISAVVFVTLLLSVIGWCVLAQTLTDGIALAASAITVAGFFVTLYELRRAKNASIIELQTYRKAADEHNAQHYSFCLTDAKAVLERVRESVRRKQWPVARYQFDDVAERIHRIDTIRSHANKRWIEYSDKLHEYAAAVAGRKNNEKLPTFTTLLWEKLFIIISRDIERELAPFTSRLGDTNATL